MKPAVFLTLVLLLKVLPDKCASTDSCVPGDVKRIRLSGSSRIKNEGAVQICRKGFNHQIRYLWYYITTDGWTETAAQVACRELGLPFTNATVANIRLTNRASTVTTPVRCTAETKFIIKCLQLRATGQRQSVAGIICNCTEGAVRLVDGYKHTEGRVEVCVNGRWGIVCGRGWTDQQAGLVCSRLGYSTTGSAFRQFGEGTGLIYTLDCQDDPNCVPILSTQRDCTHVDDLGVVCDESCPEAIGKPETLGTDSRETITTVDSIIPEERCARTIQINIGLGVLTALLTAALVAVVMGWIISCVWSRTRVNNRKSKDHTHKSDSSTHQLHLHNPVYDPGHLQRNHSYNVTALTTTYSSQGPSYEAIGHDVINRGRPHPLTTPFAPHLTDQLYSTLDQSQIEHDYHILEPNTTGSLIMGGGSVAERGDPQDYEVPTNVEY